MATKPPSAEEIRELGRAGNFELTPAEVDALTQMIGRWVSTLERVDELKGDPQPSMTRYPKRDAGAPMNRKDDPLNAIVRKVHVAGAASGKLKGMRIGLKDSVCVAGIPASGGSHVLQGYVA